mmetsp:Transcript_697/g.1606  ORF Transcript_697/g.1606 Transcript_697/m.1606 type:complete len:222 (-) Transcript_697:361-1026(-)
MAGIDRAEHPRDDLLLAVGIDLRIAQYGHDVSHLGGKRDGIIGGGLDEVPGVGRAAQRDGNAHRHAIGGTELLERLKVRRARLHVHVVRQVERVHEDGIEVQHLQERALPHESLEGGGPALADDLEPVQVEVGDQDLRQPLRLGPALGLEMLRHVQVDHLVPIGVRQSRRTELRRPLQNAVHLQPPKEDVRALLDLQLVRPQRDLRLHRRLVRIVDTSKMP